ncbi:MAG: cytochrome c/FTR1 family iron permease [Deltaproteobacteria bacterium]|nr:cytochrome c/FTR1 family iron permease [Deltaproteobacteria bacterium]
MTGFFLVFFSAVISASSPSVEKSPRALVHLLDYLASDYGGAVQNGKVTNEGEYQEQVEFVNLVVEISSALSFQKDPSVPANILKLKQKILNKASAGEVAALALSIKKDVVSITHLPTTPKVWPSLTKGKNLFVANCTSCHGVTGHGDGPAAVALNPKPANFHDDELMQSVSAFKAFNVIKVGIPGTGMAPFPALSEEDIWNLSFYLLSLRHEEQKKNSSPPTLSLAEVSTSSDLELLSKMNGKDDDEKKASLIALRLHEDDGSGTGGLKFARVQLDNSLQAYKDKEFESAKSLAISAYLEGIELIEPKLRSRDQNLLGTIEKRMAEVRSAIASQTSFENVEATIISAKETINEVDAVLSREESSPWLTFSMSSGILFREGFEALLIILAILGVIRAVGAQRAARSVHSGWIVGILLGIVCWFFSGWLIGISGAQREYTEGIASLLAVTVLLYMGFWLHSRTEISRWTSFIDGRVRQALEGGSRWGLFTLAFIAVFREAFETVLFLRAIWIEGGGDTKAAMTAGVIFALAAVIFLGWLLLKYSVRLPIRQLFSASSVIMGILSVILVGKGFHSLQETGMISATIFSFPLQLPLFGVFPTIETVLAQGATLVGCAALWVWGSRSPKKAVQVAEAE